MKAFFTITGILGFVILLGAAGASDLGTMSFAVTVCQALGGLFLMIGSIACLYKLNQIEK